MQDLVLLQLLSLKKMVEKLVC